MANPAEYHGSSGGTLENLVEWLEGIDANTPSKNAVATPEPAMDSEEKTVPPTEEITVPEDTVVFEEIKSPPPELPEHPPEKAPSSTQAPNAFRNPPRRGRLQDVLLRLEATEKFGHVTFRPSSATASSKISKSEPPSKPGQAVTSEPNESVPDSNENKPVPADRDFQTFSAPAALAPQQQLQLDSLVTKVEAIDTALTQSQEKIAHLEAQIYQPTELINPLLPLITELLQGKIAEVGVTREEIFHLVVPIIDRVIRERSSQDKQAMSRAFSSLIPEAISHHIHHSPDEIANAIGPTMGRAIKEQIRLERDSMVDALYPVIGNTIAKYMGEVVRTINEKVEKTLSMEGFQRKLRARWRGVSEAELIMEEALPFQVSAAFLIHKASGLVIAEAQQVGDDRLESEMVAGMLTAIRSFANDCFAKGTNKGAELSEIEYDRFKIVIEVAGYCYLAVVNRGMMPRAFVQKIRETLVKIIEYYDKSIQNFDGDTDKVPKPIPALLESLIIESAKEEYKRGHSSHLFTILVSIALLIAVVFIIREFITNYQETQVLTALDSTPELAVYRLDVESHVTTIILKGKLPNERLRWQAEMVALNTFPGLELENQIVAVDVPPDPVLAQGEVKRIADIFNQQEDVKLSADYLNRKVFVAGQTDQTQTTRAISKAFAAVPGIQSVVVAMEQPSQQVETAFAQRIYFELSSDQLEGAETERKINLLQKFLEQYPDVHLKITGHSDTLGRLEFNQELARRRASAVKQALQARGIDENRLFIEGIGEPPPDVIKLRDDTLSRCVRFEKLDAEEFIELMTPSKTDTNGPAPDPSENKK